MLTAGKDQRQLSVLLLGEDAPAALMQSYATGFRRAGVRVEQYCLVRAFRGALSRGVARVTNRIARNVMLDLFNRRLLRDIRGRSYDFALVLKGEGISPETIAALRAASGSPWLNFFPDDPFTDVSSNRLAFGTATLREYDRCLTFAKHLLPTYRREGVAHVDWLPFARDPDQHTPPDARTPPAFDTVFVGNLDVDRIEWLEPVARTLKVAVFGEHTRAALPRRSALRRASFFPAVYGPGLAIALTRGAISLNVMRHQNRFSHNMRSYESLACGAFTLSQRTPELMEMFSEGKDVVFAGSPEEMSDCAQRWLADPAGRERIARAGFARVEYDTYQQRAVKILTLLGLGGDADD